MLQRSMTHHTAVVRLLVTAVFVVLGWAYLHSPLRSHRSEGPIGLSIDYRLAARSAGPSAGIGLDSEGTVLNHLALQDEHGSPPAQRRSAEQSSENQSGRRQALTMFTALLIQIQSAGIGGK
jgi:hypothetical protein